MTHRELTKDDKKGFASPCPGEVSLLESFPDTVMEGGTLVTRTVHLWACRGCLTMIPVTCTGAVLNCYGRDQQPGVVAAELAGRLDRKEV